MRWKWLDFTQHRVPEKLWDFHESLAGHRLMRAAKDPESKKDGTRVPVWTLDLWDATIIELEKRIGPTYPTKLRGVFRERVRRCAAVVNKPGGVDPDVFAAALRLGGWVAAQALHSRLRPAPRLSPLSGAV